MGETEAPTVTIRKQRQADDVRPMQEGSQHAAPSQRQEGVQRVLPKDNGTNRRNQEVITLKYGVLVNAHGKRVWKGPTRRIAEVWKPGTFWGQGPTVDVACKRAMKYVTALRMSQGR